MLKTNSTTLRKVVQADLNQQPRANACWTAQLLSAFEGLRVCESYVRAVQTGCAVSMQDFTTDLEHRMRGVWRYGGLARCSPDGGGCNLACTRTAGHSLLFLPLTLTSSSPAPL